MFVSFLYPFRIRDTHAPFLWVFYKQLAHFKPDEIIYLASEDYFVDPETYRGRWEFNPGAQAGLGYTIPAAAELTDLNKHVISTSLFDDLRSLPTTNSAWKKLITEPHEKLERELDAKLREILRAQPVEAILTWCNCKSLSTVAERHGIRVIHNEQGPTRKPFYVQTAYLDFAGVNGNTEAKSRFQRFKAETASNPVTLLSKKELLYLITDEAFLPTLPSTPSDQQYPIGLALQIEDDSNILAYSNGYDNFELINCARKIFDRDSILIRKHPRGHLDYKENLGVIDQSKNAFEFFSKVRRVATINSSVGLEAILHDKITYILGDSPFSFMAYNRLDTSLETAQIEDELLALNFIIFGYLIPYELLFNADYYRWRVADRTEREVYEFHLDFYRRQEISPPEAPDDCLSRGIFIHAIENRVRNIARKNVALQQQLTQCRQELVRCRDLELVEEQRSELERQLQQKTLELLKMDAKLVEFAEEFAYASGLRAELEKYLDQRSLEIVSRDERIKLIHREIELAREIQVTLEANLAEKAAMLAEREERISLLEAEINSEGRRQEEHLRRTDELIRQKDDAYQSQEDYLRTTIASLEREMASLRENTEVERLRYEQQIMEQEEQIRRRDRRIENMLTSMSWKVTGPFRATCDLLKGKK